MKKLLPLFSYLFHPLFISVYAVLTYFLFGETYFDYTAIYIVIIQIVIITIFIPVTFYYLLLSMGKVDSIMLASTNQRRIPLVIHSLLLVVLVNKSIPVTVCPELYYFFVGSLYSTLLALLFVLFGKKASLHMVGMLAFAVFVVGISLHYQTRMIFFVVTVSFCCGFVATSRLEMKAHTEREVVLGSLIGAVPQIILLPHWL